MNGENFEVRASLIAKDEASPAIRAATESLAAFERQIKALGAVMGKGMGAELARSFESVITNAKALGSTMTDGAEKGTRALNSETVAARELRDALREVASAQDAVARGAGHAAGGGSSPRSPSGGGNGNRRPGETAGAGGDLRDVRARWRIREASLAAEHRDAERERRAQASAAAAQVRARDDAFNQRLRQQRYLIGVRERSEAAELRHIAGLRREHESMRRRAASAGQHAYRHGRHALRSINHPALESPGHAAALGAAFGIAAAERIVKGTVEIDEATTKYRMFAVPTGVDPAIATAEAVRKAKLDSIRLGVGAAQLLDAESQAVRDGIPSAIAKTLPASIAQAAKVMGGTGNVEKMTDTLSEGVQQGLSMGLIKSAKDVRSFLNMEAGLSNYAGNSAIKQEQFISAGGLGHGKEMGLSLTDTMAFGALLNSSGARTGLSSARFMGTLSQNVPKMYDKFRAATMSHKNTEQERAIRSAPRVLGYGNIREMQAKLLSGPEGVIDFAGKLNKLNEKQRKLILEGYGFSEQGGAMIAEIGANPAKANGVLKRAKELAEQTEANDYLSQKFKDWQTSLANMLQQIEAGWKAIESEIGDVLKDDLIAPFRTWWVDLSTAIVGGNLREKVHHALMGFVHGLGFEDVAAMLKTLSLNVGGFDLAGFATGLGEGIRAVVDDFRSLASALSGAGGMDARTLGKLAAEMLGLSLALHFVAPIVTTIGGIASAFLAVKAALEGAAWISRLTGLSSGLSAIVGVDLAAGAAGLISFAGALGVISATVQALLSTGVLPKVTLLPKDTTSEGIDSWLWGKKPDGTSARPEWFDRWLGSGDPKAGAGLSKGAHGGLVPSSPAFKPTAYQGATSDYAGMIVPAAYVTDSNEDASAGNRDRDTAAMLGTSRAAQRIADNLEGIVPKLSMTASASTITGFGGGEGGGTPNLRYGRGAGGGYRGTPGTGQDYETGPKVSLGKMGAKFAQKAPVIMDGLMKKYGLTREQAAGVVGNLGHESGGFTQYHEGGQAPNKGGVGWAQWTGSRRRAFEAWTSSHGLNPTSDEASWRYLTEGDPETAKAIRAVKGQTTAHGAAKAFEESFERAGVKAYGSRFRFADQALKLQPHGADYAGKIAETAKKLGAAPASPVAPEPPKVPTSSDLAAAAKSGPKGSHPVQHHAPVQNHMVTASAAPVTIHAPIHINGHQDPHHLAKVIGDHLATLQRRQFTDAMV